MFGPQKLLGTLFAFLIVLSLAACGGSTPATAPTAPAAEATAAPAAEATAAPEATAATEADGEGKTLVIGTAEDTTSLDPGRVYETTPGIIHKATYQTLVTFPDDNVGSIVPDLARDWTISDDGKTYTFTLNDATFNDGSPVTAEDVAFSFTRMKNLKGNPSFLADTIASVTASDDKTVVLTLSQTDPAILAKLVFPSFSVLNADEAKANGATDAEDADKTDTAESYLNSHSIGSGPYTLESWDKGVETILARNPNYSGTAPAIERVIIRNIPEAATQKLQLETGDIQIATDLSADQIGSLKTNPSTTVYEGQSDIVAFLLMNQDPTIGGPLSDPKVQRAVRLAIDYEGLKALIGGQTVTPASIIPIGFAGAYGEDKAITRDVEAAKQLLAEAGQSAITVELEYPDFTSAGINFGTVAQKIQADLAEVGITVNLKPGDVQVALQNYRDGKESFGLWYWGPDYRDSLDYVEFLPAGVVGNRVNWTDENADTTIKDLRDQVRVEVDDTKRAELFGQIQDYLQQQGPFAPLLQPGIQIGLTSNVKNFVYNPQWRINVALLDIE